MPTRRAEYKACGTSEGQPIRCGECHEALTGVVQITEDRGIPVEGAGVVTQSFIVGYLNIPCAHDVPAYWTPDGRTPAEAFAS